MRAWIAALCALSVMCIAAGALAQTSENDVALAESLFQQAQALMKEQRYAEACPKFEESHRLDPAGGTLFQLATCHAATRRVASAWAEFLEVALLAKQRNRPDIEAAARKEAALLEPQLPLLVVVVPGAARVEGLTVRRDHTVLGAATFDTALPVDPGKRTIRAEAPGRLPWSVTIEIEDAPGRRSVTIPKLAPAPPPPEKRAARSPVLFYSALGVGVAGVGVATFFGVRSYSKEREAREACPDADAPCTDASAVSASKAGVTSATVATVAGAAGLVGLGFAMYAWLSDAPPEPAPRRAALRVSPLAAPGGAALALDGSF